MNNNQIEYMIEDIKRKREYKDKVKRLCWKRFEILADEEWLEDFCNLFYDVLLLGMHGTYNRVYYGIAKENRKKAIFLIYWHDMIPNLDFSCAISPWDKTTGLNRKMTELEEKYEYWDYKSKSNYIKKVIQKYKNEYNIHNDIFTLNSEV